MNWNECLFSYAQARGGIYFGLWPEGAFSEKNDGVLVLEREKGPLLLCAKVTYSGQYGAERDISASMRVTLERPYTLRINPKSAVREGLNTLLDGLDRGAKLLGKKTDLSPDYGAPEAMDGRGVKTSEPDFTRWVLQSRELQEALSARPEVWLQVGPMGPETREHLVEVRLDQVYLSSRETMEEDDQLVDWAVRQERQRRRQIEILDALVELAELARGAVTAWPMPMKAP